MIVKTSVIENKSRENIVKLTDRFFKKDSGIGLDGLISEVLFDKDLFVYMATHSIPDSGIGLGRMYYFDDIQMHIPWGISYNFKDPSLDIFTFEFAPHSVGEVIPSKTLRRGKVLPAKKGMGIGTSETYSNYPTVENFIKSLNRVLQSNIEEQKFHWIDFNKPFYH